MNNDAEVHAAPPAPCAVCGELEMHKRTCLLAGRYDFRTPVHDLQRATYQRQPSDPIATIEALRNGWQHKTHRYPSNEVEHYIRRAKVEAATEILAELRKGKEQQ